MTTGLSFNGTSTTNSYVNQMATMAVVDPTDTAFVEILPSMITYAENRIYRDLDFLFTSASNSNYSVLNGARKISIPPGANFGVSGGYGGGVLVVAEQINLLTPAGTTDPEGAIRIPLLPTTKEFLDAAYGDPTYLAMPKYFCPFDDYLFYVGPFPDQSYTIEIVGTYRPDSFGPSASDATFLANYQTYTGTAYPNYASTTTTTFISLYLPELFIMASMIYISAYQRNFSSAMSPAARRPMAVVRQSIEHSQAPRPGAVRCTIGPSGPITHRTSADCGTVRRHPIQVRREIGRAHV